VPIFKQTEGVIEPLLKISWSNAVKLELVGTMVFFPRTPVEIISRGSPKFILDLSSTLKKKP
jgi:hypothetical protein